jgi:hypothetical protein
MFEGRIREGTSAHTRATSEETFEAPDVFELRTGSRPVKSAGAGPHGRTGSVRPPSDPKLINLACPHNQQ